MTEELFREDSYLKECDATVVAIDDGALILDRTVFYPLGGGQPGDAGTISWDGGSATVVEPMTTATKWIDTTAAAGTIYYYWVTAWNSNGESGFSDS